LEMDGSLDPRGPEGYSRESRQPRQSRQLREYEYSEISPLLEHGLGANAGHSTTDVSTHSQPVSRSTTTDRVFVLTGILLIGWSYGLDGLLRYTYQSYAASSFGEHTLLSTINVLRSVIAAAVYPPAAKIADVFGRFELITVSIAFYIIGTAVESMASSIEAFIAGAILYQTGYTCIVLLVEVVIADITSMRSRVFFSYVPAIPFLLNTWISGTLASAVLKNTDWRWGIGMWSIIYAVSAAPLLVALYKTNAYVENDDGVADHCRGGYSRLEKLRERTVDVFHQLDVVGISLMVAILTLILTPLTLAEGQASRWRSPAILGPLALGCCCIPVFLYWESHGARHPFIPGYLLKDRGVGTALA
ncbi:ferrioxamine B transporter, partial [Elasticomyces elasticus]